MTRHSTLLLVIAFGLHCHVALASDVMTISSTGNVSSLAISTTNDLVIFCDNPSLLVIQGISAGATGQHVTIVSIGSGQVELAYNSSAATAADRILTFATSNNTALAPMAGTSILVYDGSKWRMLAHEQGAPLALLNGFGLFTYPPDGWTTASTATGTYYLKGRSLTVSFYISGTSSAPTAQFNIPYMTASDESGRTYSAVQADDNFVMQTSPGIAEIASGSRTVYVYKDYGANQWSPTGLKQVVGTVTGISIR